jgi:hypothetical protein
MSLTVPDGKETKKQELFITGLSPAREYYFYNPKNPPTITKVYRCKQCKAERMHYVDMPNSNILPIFGLNPKDDWYKRYPHFEAIQEPGLLGLGYDHTATVKSLIRVVEPHELETKILWELLEKLFPTSISIYQIVGKQKVDIGYGFTAAFYEYIMRRVGQARMSIAWEEKDEWKKKLKEFFK